MKIQIDKIKHFAICIAIAFATILVSVVLLKHPLFTSAVVGVFAALFVGMLKELYDAFAKGRDWDKWDLLADAAGGVVGAVICLLILLIF